jgi:hypothetical protein
VTETNQASEQAGASGSVALAFAWLVVLIPLGWGVAQTIKKALALFS